MANKSIRYGVNLRKREASVIKQKNTKYKCDVCGKEAVKRVNVAIWNCSYCNATFAGGAYTYKTSSGDTAKKILGRN